MEQEKNTKIKQISFFVGQAVSILSNYIDFKSTFQPPMKEVESRSSVISTPSERF